MKKYFAFAKIILKEQMANLVDKLGTIFSFCIHIVIFSTLWDFVLEGKTLAGYTKQELIWYVIMAEAILYSFHYYYKKVAFKVEMGDFAYDMSKPYNFLARTIVEGISELPITIVLLLIGLVLGVIFAGTISINILGIIATLLIMVMATILLLMLNIIIGLMAIWLGRDVSSLWLLIGKAMLIFAFSPIELFPKWIQGPLLALPTTHVIYTPANLLVHFSKEKFIVAVIYELLSILVVGILLAIIYKKGVKKQNVNGI